MEILSYLWKIIKWLFKVAFKLSIIILRGVISVVEEIIHHLNAYLKKIIS